MKIICVIKFVPDVNRFQYNFETNTVVRENVRMVLNPDDEKCIALALKMKESNNDISIEVVSMGPKNVKPLMYDLIRLGIDQGTLLSDMKYMGSDSYATSYVLGTYLRDKEYDLILSGTHSIDGDTSHVPTQVADLLDIPQMSNVISVDYSNISAGEVLITVDDETSRMLLKMELPGILSLNRFSSYKCPYIRYEDMNKDVSSQIRMLSNEDLKIPESKLGLNGSLTRVNRTFVKSYGKRDKEILKIDEEGIERVFTFLKANRYIKE